MRRMTALEAQQFDPLELPDEFSSCCAAVHSLILNHFRNYASLKLETSSLPVILTGPNGAGKTNILEALSLLAPGRGLRGAKLEEIDYLSGNCAWAIHAVVEGTEGKVEIGTGRAGEENVNRRTVKIDGKQIRGQAALAKKLSLLWITPQMDGIFLESDSVRRKFLDRLAINLEPEHASHITAYDHASRERMKLLEDGKPDDVWLSALEQEMAFRALHMAKTRQYTTEKLNAAMQSLLPPFPRGILTTEGLIESHLEDKDSEEIIALGAEKLKHSRLRDAAAGRITEGLHRSVLHTEFNLPGRNEKKNAAQCSTGEQKALLLSIMLAGCKAAHDRSGFLPILLLDEVVAHLDEDRRDALFDVISELGVQAWLTGTDRALFSGLESRAQRFEIREGRAIG